MPRKGKKKKSEEEAAAERLPAFMWRRRGHSGVESDINSLEKHGATWPEPLARQEVAWVRALVGLGVLAHNLHRIGAHLLALDRSKQRKAAEKAERKAQDARLAGQVGPATDAAARAA